MIINQRDITSRPIAVTSNQESCFVSTMIINHEYMTSETFTAVSN